MEVEVLKIIILNVFMLSKKNLTEKIKQKKNKISTRLLLKIIP
jgi:hypothetical protein